jgi:hypothetical protein
MGKEGRETQEELLVLIEAKGDDGPGQRRLVLAAERRRSLVWQSDTGPTAGCTYPFTLAGMRPREKSQSRPRMLKQGDAMSARARAQALSEQSRSTCS